LVKDIAELRNFYFYFYYYYLFFYGSSLLG